ncbi:MAG: hypothetical protein C0459_01905 [Chitinophaga sp.]|jgi:hypothetical protein|nr:hypothetical protein [Chitinophaga sp.]
MNYDLIYHIVLKWIFQTLAAIAAYYLSFLFSTYKLVEADKKVKKYIISYGRICLLIIGFYIFILFNNHMSDIDDRINNNTIASYFVIMSISAFWGTFKGLKEGVYLSK